jgi:hypothetical protein
MESSILDEVIEQLRGMPQGLQKQVLEFARTLSDSTIQGVPGSQLLRFAGTISPDDIALMRDAIEQDCEQVEQWSDAILSYEGIPNFPAFESYRDEFLCKFLK